MRHNFTTITLSRKRALVLAGLVLAAFVLFPVLANAQSTRTRNAANADWGAYWSKFSAAINHKDRRQFISLTSKDFTSGGGETVQQWFDGQIVSWASLRRSVRRGTKHYKGRPGDILRITKDNDLIFEYKRGKWGFIGQLIA